MPNFDLLSESWSKYKYPWKPNNRILQEISPLFNEWKKICLLWSTKEIRSLCKTNNCDIDIYDLSYKMYVANSVDNINEKFYSENWFHINNKKYDIIYGDLILFLFPQDQQQKLIDTLSNNLSKNGKIILRIWSEKKYPQTLDFYTQVSLIKNISYDEINQICYELIVWKNIWSDKILNLLQEKNLNVYNFLKTHFSHLIPYWKEGTKKINTNIKFKTIYKNDFLLSSESIIEII